MFEPACSRVGKALCEAAEAFVGIGACKFALALEHTVLHAEVLHREARQRQLIAVQRAPQLNLIGRWIVTMTSIASSRCMRMI